MQKHVALFAAAAMAAGAFAFVGYDSSVLAADEGVRASVTVDQGATLPQGVKRAEQADTQGIWQTLAGTTQSIFSEGGYRNLTSYLIQTDRAPIADLGREQNDQLKNEIDTFKQAWKAKYNSDFNLKEKTDLVFGNTFQGFTVVQGEVTDPVLLSNWPVEPTRGTMDREQQQPGGNKAEPSQPGSPKGPPLNPGERADAGVGLGAREGVMAQGRVIQRGTNVALVTFPAEHGAPSVTVSLVKEGGAGVGAGAGMGVGEAGARADINVGGAAGNWKIDIPDTITGDKLQTSLQKHIAELNSMKDQWPADQTEAYRLVAHHVMAGLYSLPAGQEMK